MCEPGEKKKRGTRSGLEEDVAVAASGVVRCDVSRSSTELRSFVRLVLCGAEEEKRNSSTPLRGRRLFVRRIDGIVTIEMCTRLS